MTILSTNAASPEGANPLSGGTSPSAAAVTPIVRGRRRNQSGQATAEYALVLLGAAAVALLIVAWATKTNLVNELFDSVMNSVLGKAAGK